MTYSVQNWGGGELCGQDMRLTGHGQAEYCHQVEGHPYTIARSSKSKRVLRGCIRNALENQSKAVDDRKEERGGWNLGLAEIGRLETSEVQNTGVWSVRAEMRDRIPTGKIANGKCCGRRRNSCQGSKPRRSRSGKW